MSNLSWCLSLILFAISTCGTPGPNNYMIIASGINYGVKRSIPHVVGINIGFPLMVIAVGLGFGGVLRGFPMFYDILRPIGVAYLLYLAYRIATASVDTADAERRSKPLSLVQAAAFQVVNPKAWVMTVGALVTYGTATGPSVVEVLLIALVFFIFGTPCTCTWLWLGASLKKLLARPLYFRIFNVGMAVLLVVSIVPAIVELYHSLAS